MNARKARFARKIALDEAKRAKLWDKEIDKPNLWQRIVEMILFWKRGQFKKARVDRKGRWYRWAVKRMTRNVKAFLKDKSAMRDAEAMTRARERIKRKDRDERFRKWKESIA